MTNRNRLRLALATLGLTSTVAQVLLVRELVATLYGNELLLGFALAAWLGWVALGAWGLGQTAFVRRMGARGLAAGLGLAAPLLVGQIALVRGARTLLGVTPGALVELGPAVGIVAAGLAPLCLVSGALFSLGARLAGELGLPPGRAYAWESVGAVAGGGLYGLLLVHLLDPFQMALLVGAVGVSVALAIIACRGEKARPDRPHPTPCSPLSQPLPSEPTPSPLPNSGERRGCARQATGCADGDRGRGEGGGAGSSGRKRGGRPLLYFLPALALLTAAALLAGPSLHAVTLAWQWPDLAFAADSAYGRITVQARGGQRVFYQNGLLAFETQGTFPEEMVHLPLLAHPDPRRVLLAGGGAAGDVRELLKQPVEGVTYVELDPLLIEAAEAHLPHEEVALLHDPRVDLVLTDGRITIREAGRDAYDVVLLDLPAPSTGALNRYYTQEFFQEVHAALAPGGLLALGLPSAENYWSPELARRNGSVYHTLRQVFSEVIVLPGEHNLFLASDAPLETDPAVMAGRLDERGIETRWVTPAYVEYVYTTDRFAGVQAELEAMAGVRTNSDLAPVCYYYDLALWLTRVSLPGAGAGGAPLLRRAFEGPDRVGISPWWAAVGLAPLVLLARRRKRWAVPFAIACVGLAEMMLEVVILFGFQTLHGTLYARVSLIVTAFVGGLALGSAASNRVLARRGGAARWALPAVVAGVAAWGGLLPLGLSLPIPLPPAAFVLLALVAGGLTGAAFPLAVARMAGDPAHAAGLLYGADLLGGSLGALVGGALLVPLLGIPQTCVVIVLVGLAGLAAAV